MTFNDTNDSLLLLAEDETTADESETQLKQYTASWLANNYCIHISIHKNRF